MHRSIYIICTVQLQNIELTWLTLLLYSYLIRGVQESAAQVPASLPPAYLSLCYRDNRGDRATHQSSSSVNDKRYKHYWLDSGEGCVSVWMVLNRAVLLCNNISYCASEQIASRNANVLINGRLFLLFWVLSIDLLSISAFGTRLYLFRNRAQDGHAGMWAKV